jgi:hypothetical protein
VVNLHHVAPGVVPVAGLGAAVKAVARGCALQWAVAGVVRVDAVACAVVVPVLFTLADGAAVILVAVHHFAGQALLGVVAVALAAVGLALGWLPGLGRGVQAQVLDVVELADAVVVVVAAQVHQVRSFGVGFMGLQTPDRADACVNSRIGNKSGTTQHIDLAFSSSTTSPERLNFKKRD